MKLYLVQHGEALDKAIDPDRPLSEHGHRDIDRLAGFLEGRRRVSRVLHSGKSRARQTADRLQQAMAPDGMAEAVSGLGPNDTVAPWQQMLTGLNEDQLVVGHLPFMDRLVALLVSGDEHASLVEFRPGSMACLESDDKGHWRILWMIRPELLRD